MTTATAKHPRVTKAWRKLLCSLPGYDPFLQAEGCWFDAKIAEDYIGFIQECCTHIEGAKAGQKFLLEPWQKAIVGNLFGWQRIDDLGRTVRRYREAMIYVARKNGKAISLETPLPTPAGWTTMGQVKVGDTLFDEFGEQCKVLRAYPVMTDHPCYRVTFSDGTSIVADAEHLWRTRTRIPDRCQTWTTEQIAATLTYGNRTTHRERNHSISVALPLETPEVDLLIDPYVLGAWLGDGESATARITCSVAKMPVFDAIAAAGVSVGPFHREFDNEGIRCLLGGGDRSNRPQSLQAQLRQLGVLGNKHIPAVYLRASSTQRTALLQGLMDTDGYASKAGQCEFTSTRIELARGVLELLRSLGMKPTIHEGRAMLRGKDCGPKYRIQFWATSGIAPFRLPYKLNRVRYPKETARSRTRQIVSVEPVESVPVRCIQVDSPSHLFLAGEGMVPTHNSPLCAAIANAVFFFDDERGQQDYCAAADRDQASIVFRHIQGMIEAEPEMMARVTIYKTTRTVEQAGTGSYIKVLSADANTKHGGNSHLIIVDELHAQPNRELVDVLQTSMASANRVQPLLLFITTADFDRPSICNEKYAYACKVRDNIVHDPAFLPVVYEVPKDADWKSEKVWPLANPNLDVSVSRDYLRRECLKAKENPAYENTFRRLHMNQITEQAERCIPMDAWDACAAPPICAPGQSVWAALDIGASRDFCALVCLFQDDAEGEPITVEIENQNGEKQQYQFVRHSYSLQSYFWLPETPVSRNPRMDDQIKAWKKQKYIIETPGDVVDYDHVAADITRILNPYALQQFAIDQGFQGIAITQTLQKVYGERVVAFRQGILSMAAPCREMLELLPAKRLRHGGHPVLRWMASNVAAEKRGGLIKFSKDKSAEKIDGMTAAAMALGVAMTAPPEPQGSVYEERGIVVIGGDE